MKIIILIGLSTFALNAFSATPVLSRENNSSEKCLITSAVTISNPKKEFDIYANSKEINIYNESAITTDGSQGPFATLVTLAFKKTPGADIIPDRFYQTIQNTTFTDKLGNPTTINEIDNDAFQSIYTHSYESNVRGQLLKISVKHSVAQIIDHWASKDVVVTYERTSSYNSLKGILTFKCSGYATALDILK